MAESEGEIANGPLADASEAKDTGIDPGNNDVADLDNVLDVDKKVCVDNTDGSQEDTYLDHDITIGENNDHYNALDPDEQDAETQLAISSDIMSPKAPGIQPIGDAQPPETGNVPAAAAAAAAAASEPPVVFNSKDNPCPEPAWDLPRPRHSIDRLDQLCCKLIASSLNQSSLLDAIPSEYLPSVISRIDPTQVDILQAARNVHSDQFWKFMSMQWPLADFRQHGCSYKRLFFEQFLQERFESYHENNRSDLNRHDFMAELEVARPYVHTIRFREQRSHLNLAVLLKGFFNLTRLDMRYGASNLGMMYDADEFGIKGNDILGLNKLLAETRSLTTLLIRESLLNDELVGVLSRGLLSNQTLTHLDLSHNRIGDEGALRLVQVLAQDSSVLICLNLSDNNLGPVATTSLAQALRTNNCLQRLSLRLNQVGKDGAISLFDSLKENLSLVNLNLSCNGIQEIDQDLINLLRCNHTLQCLDLSCNNAIRLDYGPALIEAVKSMSQLWEFDLRLNPGFSDQLDNELQLLLANRQERLDRARRLNYLTDWALV